MLSQIYFNTCVTVWSWLAQVSPAPAGSPVPAAPGAPPPEAPVIPVTGMPDAVNPVMNGAPMDIPAGAYTVAHQATLFLYFLVCIALVTCVTFQTTKNEGLSGVIGGQVQSSMFRGKKSAEETLSAWTTRLAVAFIIFSMVLWFVFGSAR